MLKILAIIIGKIIILVGKLCNRGSSLPGQIALKLCPNLLKGFRLPKTVVAITGSSGKGSTSSVLAKIYKELGYSVAHNSSGANLTAGITTCLLENCSLTGVVNKDVFIYEMDERFAKFVFPNITPSHVVITNITKDQPPRQFNVDVIFDEIKKALPNGCHLILNGDDPYLRKFNLNNEFVTTYYSVKQTNDSYTENKFTNLNMYYCPCCGKKLDYEYYHFETLGKYSCKNCGFTNPDSDYVVTSIDYDNLTMTVNDKYIIKLQYDLLYSVYNSMAAYTTASILGLDNQKIANAMCKLNANHKMYNHYNYKDKEVYILNNKNENSTTFNQSILMTERFKDKKTIVIGWKEISRRYNFDDLSWLYDIDFEIFDNDKTDNIVCVGPNAYDIATRIKYAGIDLNKIAIFDTLQSSKEFIDKVNSKYIFAILNFDYVEPFKSVFSKEDTK